MANKLLPPASPKAFLKKIDLGKTAMQYEKKKAVFSQGDPADAVFYVEQGQVRLMFLAQSHGLIHRARQAANLITVSAKKFFQKICDHQLVFRDKNLQHLEIPCRNRTGISGGALRQQHRKLLRLWMGNRGWVREPPLSPQ